MTKIIQQPKIAIVGRPNVGKSTFFNRLVGFRKAIESDQPGTTRDRIYAETSWCGKKFTAIDTAGLFDKISAKEMIELTSKSIEIATSEADEIIFLVDTEEITADDKNIAKTLHQSKKKIYLVANKADNQNREVVTKEILSLGFGQPTFVSAISGRGIADFLDLMTGEFSVLADEKNNDKFINVAIIGRPNVGKSTLLNSFVGYERAIVSERAGTTRDSNDVKINYKNQAIRFVDTAGIRRRGKIESGIEKFSIIRAMTAIRESDVVCVLIDAVEGLTNQDSHIIGEAKNLGKSIILAINKFDLFSNQEKEVKTKMSEILGNLQQNLAFIPFVPVIFISGKDNLNLNVLTKKIIEVYNQRFIHLEKTDLDEIISFAKNKNPQLPKISDFYQERTNPIVFKLVTKNLKSFHFSHLRYLENQIRDRFPFTGTPIFIDLEKND